MCVCVSEIQQVYRTNIISYICVVLNSCLSVAVGIVVWFLYEPPPVAAPTILYGIIGGLQLWMIFFANVVLLIGKASTWCDDLVQEHLVIECLCICKCGFFTAIYTYFRMVNVVLDTYTSTNVESLALGLQIA